MPSEHERARAIGECAAVHESFNYKVLFESSKRTSMCVTNSLLSYGLISPNGVQASKYILIPKLLLLLYITSSIFKLDDHFNTNAKCWLSYV